MEYWQLLMCSFLHCLGTVEFVWITLGTEMEGKGVELRGGDGDGGRSKEMEMVMQVDTSARNI